jgi:hypothetical protein
MMKPIILNSVCENVSISLTSGRPGFAHQRQRAAEQDRDQQHLQHVAAGERAHDRVRNQLEQEVDHARALHLVGGFDVGRHGRGVERTRIHVHAGAGMEHVGQHHAQRQRDGGDHLEIDHGLDADAPTFFSSPAPQMPATTTQNTIGPISILISLMKPSPSGLSLAANSGRAARAGCRAPGRSAPGRTGSG